MMKNRMLSCFAVLLITSASVVAANVHLNKEADLEGVKCIVADRDAQAGKTAEYKDGKVYFCCGGCAGKFAKTPKKFATQANRQLVQTGQYTQTGCPISGGPVDDSTMLTVAGAKVAFCCGKCKAKVESAEDKEAANLVFGEKAFAKGFKKAEKEG
ncbi:signal peptide protein [Rhodopirellula sp. SWK7]|nr:signal peptide protein [Rhodopirellula sp. SWK7]